MIRVLSCIGSKVELDDSERVLEHIARGKWQESYKANLCGFYSHYCKFYGIARMRVPKMVKNGFNSVCPFLLCSRKTKSPKKSRTDMKPKAVPRS
jgi:hypothetical protein